MFKKLFFLTSTLFLVGFTLFIFQFAKASAPNIPVLNSINLNCTEDYPFVDLSWNLVSADYYEIYRDNEKIASTQDTVMLLHFNENNGNALDESIYNNDGILKNGTSRETDQWGGKALSFDGNDDYVTINDSPELNLTEALTISFWVKVNNINGLWTNLILKAGTWPSRNYIITLNSDKSIHFSYHNNEGVPKHIVLSTSIDLISLNNWHYISSVLDISNNRMEIYINGNKVAERTPSGTPITVNSDLLIAANQNFDGLIDEVKIVSRGLSKSEILADYQQGELNYSAPTNNFYQDYSIAKINRLSDSDYSYINNDFNYFIKAYNSDGSSQSTQQNLIVSSQCLLSSWLCLDQNYNTATDLSDYVTTFNGGYGTGFEGICGAPKGFYYVYNPAHPSITIQTPPLPVAGNYQFSVKYSLEESENDEDLKIVCGSNSYYFQDENLKNFSQWWHKSPLVICDFSAGVNSVTLEGPGIHSVHLDAFKIGDLVGLGCGNSVIEIGEECDDGDDNSDNSGSICSTQCKIKDICAGDNVNVDYVSVDQKLWVISENCSALNRSSDSVSVNVTWAGDGVVYGLSERGWFGQSQINEIFYLNINGVDGPVSQDDLIPSAITSRFENLGDFLFTNGIQTVFMHTAHQCPPAAQACSVNIEHLCIYKKIPPVINSVTAGCYGGFFSANMSVNWDKVIGSSQYLIYKKCYESVPGTITVDEYLATIDDDGENSSDITYNNNTITFIDPVTTENIGHTCFYVVKNIDNSGNSAISDAMSDDIILCGNTPMPALNLRLEPNQEYEKIHLTWDDGTDINESGPLPVGGNPETGGEFEFKVWRSLDNLDCSMGKTNNDCVGLSYNKINSVQIGPYNLGNAGTVGSPPIPTYTDDDSIQENSCYCYKIESSNVAGSIFTDPILTETNIYSPGKTILQKDFLNCEKMSLKYARSENKNTHQENALTYKFYSGDTKENPKETLKELFPSCRCINYSGDGGCVDFSTIADGVGVGNCDSDENLFCANDTNNCCHTDCPANFFCDGSKSQSKCYNLSDKKYYYREEPENGFRSGQVYYYIIESQPLEATLDTTDSNLLKIQPCPGLPKWIDLKP